MYDIDWTGVVLGTEEDLRSAIPKRHDLVRICSERQREGACQTKVTQLEQAFCGLHQQVLRFEIAVEYAVRVAPSEAVEHLPTVGLHSVGRECVALRAHVLL